jgi:hypothetical protein
MMSAYRFWDRVLKIFQNLVKLLFKRKGNRGRAEAAISRQFNHDLSNRCIYATYQAVFISNLGLLSFLIHMGNISYIDGTVRGGEGR